jgi:hypothetical protein
MPLAQKGWRLQPLQHLPLSPWSRNVAGKADLREDTVYAAPNTFKTGVIMMLGPTMRTDLQGPSPHPPKALYHAQDIDVLPCSSDFETIEAYTCMALSA